MKIGVDYIGVSAGTVIINDEGKFFLAKRGPKARDDLNKWEFPGGSVDFYETRENAAKRNIKDKYNLNVEIIELLGVYDVIDRANKDHWISTTYFCRYIDGKPVIHDLEKCTEVGWFSLEELQELDLSRITKLNLGDLLLRNLH